MTEGEGGSLWAGCETKMVIVGSHLVPIPSPNSGLKTGGNVLGIILIIETKLNVLYSICRFCFLVTEKKILRCG